jgi:hypothetical protein
LVEHTAENSGVAGSIPALAITRRAAEGSKGFVKSAAALRGVWYDCAP